MGDFFAEERGDIFQGEEVKRIGVEEGVLAKLTRGVLPMVPGFF